MSDELEPAELIPDGGEWGAYLFENRETGVPLQLAWWFNVGFQVVSRPYGLTRPNLQVDWVSLETPSWQQLEGTKLRSDRFGQPIETSLYFFEHHRYSDLALDVLEQESTIIEISVTAWGDLDRAGPSRIEVRSNLEFTGINASAELGSAATVARRLSDFTDVSNLHQARAGDKFVFRPR